MFNETTTKICNTNIDLDVLIIFINHQQNKEEIKIITK